MKFQITTQVFSLRKLPILFFTAIVILLFAFQSFAADGDVDTSFGTNGIVNETSPFAGHFSVVVQPDGKIITAGNALVVISSPFSITYHVTVVRYNINGSRDTSFASNGLLSIILPGKNLTIPTLLLQPDGKIIVFVAQREGNPIFLRYNANGTPDNTFGANGLVVTAFKGAPSDAILQPDGKIVYASNLDGQPYCVARHNADGSLDTSFGAGGKFCAITSPAGTGNTDSIALQADGKIVFSGSFATSFTNPFDFIVFRVNSNGTIDTSFDSDGYVVTDLNGGNDDALSVIVKPDGKVLAIGSARAVNAPDTGFGLVQYNADGSLDSSFGTGGKALTTFAGGEGFTEDFPVALQPNGKIIIGRSRRRTSPNLGNETQLARFNPNGTLDTNFGIGGQIIFVPIQNVRDLVLQPDGKIVATGLNQNNESITARFFNSDTGVPINNPTPILATVNPTSAVAGSAATTLNITGTGFVQGAIIRFNGKDLTTTFTNATTLSANISASDLATAGNFPVTVFNPLPGGGISNAINFTVNAAVPTPMLTGLGVATVSAGTGGTLDLIGSNFVSSTIGYINDKAAPTTFVSSTKLTIAYTAADVSCAAVIKINIQNSPAGGGLNLMVAPTVTSITPTEVVAGSAAFTLTVNGNGFCAGTKIRWNGVARATTLVNAQQATTSILASEIASFGSAAISVISADGIASNNLSLTIKSPNVPVDSEADVTPRPNGKRNGTVAITDWVQVGRFYAGLDQVSSPQEFQRTDTAPKASLGDGKILLADWVQAGRYAIGLDAVVAAGGPTVAIPTAQSLGLATMEAERILRVVNTNFIRGQVGTMQIALDSQGNENAISFSLQYDPKLMSFLDATAGDGANGATVLVNSSQVLNGRVGIAIMLSPGQQILVGARNLVNLRFAPNGGIVDVNTTVSFSDQLLTREVVDAFATSITQISYVGSTVNITGKAVATVSAANYAGGELAADSIASVFGLQLSSMTQAAVSLPLPISLGGSQIVVKDSRGAERFAPLLYASPGQINFQIPAGSAEGIATLTVFSGAGASQSGLVIVGKVAPALFSADSTGVGLATGSSLLVRADGSRTENGLARYDAATSKFIGQPIDTGGSGDQVYVTLYGTGIKNRSDIAIVKVKIGGIEAPVEYAGAQGFFVGLDQLNIKIPTGLAGKGEVIVETSIENKTANQLRIVVK